MYPSLRKISKIDIMVEICSSKKVFHGWHALSHKDVKYISIYLKKYI